MRTIFVLPLLAAAAAAGPDEAPPDARTLTGWVRAMKRLPSETEDRRAQESIMKDASMAHWKLSTALEADPELWAHVRAEAQDLPAGDAEGTRHARQALVELLLADDHRSSRAVVKRVLDEEPDLFTNMMLIAADDEGIEGARAALRRYVAGDDPPPAALYPAIHLALRDDDAGRAVLHRSFQGLAERATGVREFLLALAIRRVDGEAAWTRFKSFVRERAQAHLARDEFDHARNLVVYLEFFQRLGDEKRIDVRTVGRKANNFLFERRKDIDSAEAVRDLLAKHA